MNLVYILSHCFDKSKGVLGDVQLQLIYSSWNFGVCFLKTCVFYRYFKNLRSNPNQWPGWWHSECLKSSAASVLNQQSFSLKSLYFSVVKGII